MPDKPAIPRSPCQRAHDRVIELAELVCSGPVVVGWEFVIDLRVLGLAVLEAADDVAAELDRAGVDELLGNDDTR